MGLSKTELNVIKEISLGNTIIKNIALNLNKSEKQIYRIIKTLKEKKIILNKSINKQIHLNFLVRSIIDYPNLINFLSGIGINLLQNLPSSIKNLEKKLKVKKSMIYNKIKIAKKINLIKKEKNYYHINEKIWPDIFNFINQLNLFEKTIDYRLPDDAKIYYKNNQIIFSSKQKINATLTAFSIYEKYGIKLYNNKYFYVLPKQNITLKKLFEHSLKVVSIENDISSKIFLSLLYIKYKPNIRHEILTNIKKILKGNYIKNYPTLNEIKDRADLYDIKL
jgi:predicted transcriptional regulator